MVSFSTPSVSDEASASARSDPASVLIRIAPVLEASSVKFAGNRRQLRRDLLEEGTAAAVLAVRRYNPAIGTVDGYAITCACNRMLVVRRNHRRYCARCERLVLDEAEGPLTPEPIDIGARERLANAVDSSALRALVTSILTSRERQVIEAVYFGSMSSKATAAKLGISAVRVGQLEGAALAKLRVSLTQPVEFS